MYGCNEDDDIFYWDRSIWEKIDGKLKYISVGKDGWIWGCNSSNEIFRREGKEGKWELVPGSLKQLEVRHNGEVWGISFNDDIYCWICLE